ncbi:agmatine/peptidylarginine deiminase [Embleya sp. NPDC020886]|uniref:agmatine/peptidylarginine deiminase n=1 Tax=Embleya sp. NPDC020886 TaxID=3363980 RepID=UPI0037B5E69B
MPASPSRRDVLKSLAGLAVLGSGTAACGESGGSGAAEPSTAAPTGQASGTPLPGSVAAGGRVFGAEWDRHERTFMSWPSSAAIWGSDLGPVRADIAGIARAVAEYEPVVMMASPGQEDAARSACGGRVEVITLAVDDLWARDTVPVFVEDAGRLTGVDFGFNGWGNKQPHDNDAKVGRELLARYGIPRVVAPLVAEGGSFETDGRGTLLVTESSVVNDNRNPGKSRQRIEDELEQTLGVTRVVWFAGVRGEDITDAHVDSLVRFTTPGTVLLDRAFPGTSPDSWSRASDQAQAVLANAVDARGKPLDVVELPQPDPDLIAGHGDSFVSTYANFYVANGAVFVPRFGDDKADDRAQQILRDHFPGRTVVPLSIDTIASGGGGIHCATHDMPAVPPAGR